MRRYGRDARRRGHALAVALALVGAAASARARPPAPARVPVGTDTVYLRSGELVHGWVVALEPGASVKIVDAAGETRRFTWAQVATTAIGPGSPMGATAVNTPQPDRSHPRLHIDLSWPAPLYTYELIDRSHAETRGRQGLALHVERVVYRPRCRAPCDTILDATGGRVFFFGGEDIPPSREFQLDEFGPEIVATIRPGDRPRLIAGVIFTPLGAATMLLGGLFLGLLPNHEWRSVGGVGLGLGSAMLGSGIAMLVTGTTRVRLRRGSPRSPNHTY